MTTGSTETAAEDTFPVPTGAPPAPAEVREPAERPLGRAALLLLGVGLILIGLNLRIGVAAIGPMIGEIRASLGLSATIVSLLTTIPVFVFGAFAFLTPGLTRRLGMHRLLGIVLLMLAAGWRSLTTHLTGHLSTVSQGFGYLVAGFGPLGIGALHAAADSWTVPLIVLCVVLVGQLLAGVVASRPVHIRARGAREIEAA